MSELSFEAWRPGDFRTACRGQCAWDLGSETATVGQGKEQLIRVN